MPEMTAEERIQAIEREWACGVHCRRFRSCAGKADGMTVLELRQSILKEHILAAQREAKERVLERCAEIAREQAWSHARSGMENGPELNSQAIYDAIIAEREKWLKARQERRAKLRGYGSHVEERLG